MQGNSKEALAYIAGIMDGEGSIMIMKQASETFMKNRKHAHFFPCVRVGMIDRRPLDFMVNTIQVGSVYEEKSYHHKRPMFRLCLRKKEEVVYFLNTLLPYLIVKKAQAELAIKFMQECVHKPGIPMTLEKNAIRQTYWQEMRTMNGVSDAPATTERKSKRGRDMSVRLEATV